MALEELMMLWLANLYRAFKPFRELFDDSALAEATAYPGITGALRDYFETRPRFGPDGTRLAFVSWEGTYPQLFVIPVAGGVARQITHLGEAVYFMEWRPR